MSDDVLNGDLFRFYNNPDFKKINPSKYDYKIGPYGNQKSFNIRQCVKSTFYIKCP